MKHHTFHSAIKKYRMEQDQALFLSGETSEFFAAYKTQKLMEWFPDLIDKPITIVDFGCGDGLMTHYIKESFWQATVIGIDPCPESIAYAQEEYPTITFYKSDPLKPLLLPDAISDIIVSAGVFHHIAFQDHAWYVQELVRLLKPGGTLIIFEINPLNPLSVLTFRRNPIDKDSTMLWPWYAKKLLQPYGKVKTIFYCFFPTWFKVLRCLEPYMTWLPFGGLYATLLTKEQL